MTEQNEFTLTKSSRKRRIAAILIDHFLITSLTVSIVFLGLGLKFIDENNLSKLTTIMLWVIIPAFFLYFVKDSIKGISIGRWIMGIMVRDENDYNIIPSFSRLLVRNLFLIIWPVELIEFATSKVKRRIGDKVSKTVVLNNPNKPKRLPRILAIIAIGIGFFIFTFLFTASALKTSDAYKLSIKNIEINEDILKETGGITGYGVFPSGSISITNGQGQAQFEITVHGKIKDIVVYTYLEKEPHFGWQLIKMKKE